MDVGAVIVAAGLSSRMGEFKPMMKLGPTSVVRHVIDTFHRAGITQIAVVTGYKAESLEGHLAGTGVIFLRNENYRATEMFDSAKLGLAYMKERWGRVLFTPVDVPLFTADTVKKLMGTGAELACPVCQGKRGHPLLLSAAVIDAILAGCGEGGLKGAVSRLSVPLGEVEVDDSGVLRDANTPEEFAALVEYHSKRAQDVEVPEEVEGAS